MRYKRFFTLAILFVSLLTLVACSNTTSTVNKTEPSKKLTGEIYLYGEQHAVDEILDKEFEVWCDYYENQNMRHLFIETSYYSAEFLNLWMHSDNDDIYEEMHEDAKGSLVYNDNVKEFYKKIKSRCPETIFHGTDVGHQYDSTGARFLKYLEDNNLEDSEQYALTKEAIDQGKIFYNNSSNANTYRENKMTENFQREFDKLNGENIMGIYGSAHTGLDAMEYSIGSVPCMANQLKEEYGDLIHSVDLGQWLVENIKPERVDTILVNDNSYEASYFGKQDITGIGDYVSREFWRLENAYNDFKDKPKTGDVLPYNNYPMAIETGQVFVIDYEKKDGSIERSYQRSDGGVWQGSTTTEEFAIDEP